MNRLYEFLDGNPDFFIGRSLISNSDSMSRKQVADALYQKYPTPESLWKVIAPILQTRIKEMADADSRGDSGIFNDKLQIYSQLNRIYYQLSRCQSDYEYKKILLDISGRSTLSKFLLVGFPVALLGAGVGAAAIAMNENTNIANKNIVGWYSNKIPTMDSYINKYEENPNNIKAFLLELMNTQLYKYTSKYIGNGLTINTKNKLIFNSQKTYALFLYNIWDCTIPGYYGLDLSGEWVNKCFMNGNLGQTLIYLIKEFKEGMLTLKRLGYF